MNGDREVERALDRAAMSPGIPADLRGAIRALINRRTRSGRDLNDGERALAKLLGGVFARRADQEAKASDIARRLLIGC